MQFIFDTSNKKGETVDTKGLQTQPQEFGGVP